MTFRTVSARPNTLQRHAGKKVLLVEDSRMFSTVLKHGLETGCGLLVTHCSSLSALKSIIEADGCDFSLAVLDLNLPDGPNCQALDYIISRRIAAVVFTGTFNDRTREDILSRDVVDCVIKNEPGSIAQVIALVDRTLTNSETHVLLVDSDDISRETMVRMLERQRFPVIAAPSGTDALNHLDSGRNPDVVITDLHLSDMTGYALLGEIRERHGVDAFSIVGLGPVSDRLAAARFLQAGGSEFMARPFIEEEFYSRLFQIATMRNRIRVLHDLAARDYLTELYNRRYFFQQGPRLVEVGLRREESTSIAILDIDHFKRLNDTYGHEVGDVVLKAVANRLKAMVGDKHLLARLGGEEFGILFDGLDVHKASKFCETLLQDIASTKIAADDEELTITISIGLAPIEGYEAFENYLNAADQFLYMAKFAGRNCIVSELTLINSMAS